ncbi:MAG TPA: phage holin family protein [Syntrophomonadaceae bacterium]|nr:phage holin family protein [Syntrophomonadaceae bacterium]
MKKTLLSLPVNAVVLYISSLLLPSVQINGFAALLLAVLTLTLLNALLRPLIMLAALPVNLLAMGLPVLVINAWMIMLADWLIPAVTISGFCTAVLVAILLVLSEYFSGHYFLTSH